MSATPKQSAPNNKDLVAFVEDLKRQWMETIDALVDPLIMVNSDYQVTKANMAMAKMANQDIKDIINQKCYKVFARRDSPCENCRMQESVKENSPQQFELKHVNGDRFYEVTSQPIFDRDHKLSGVVQVYRDRTEQQKLREQLLQSEKLASIGLLAGGIAHEINNPLGGILVFSQMLLRELPKDSPHSEDVKEILAATERCKGIVENLLDFARTRSANRKSNETDEVNLVEAAKTALRFAKVSIPQHLIDVEEIWEEDSMVINADRNKLIQLFLNLYQNAVQAMPDGGTLSLQSCIQDSKEGKTAVITVSDTGVGIPPKHLPTIFDPFFTTKEPGEGTGLGLAICYGIVQELEGDIKVESVVNEGTRFKITFPLSRIQQIKSA